MIFKTTSADQSWQVTFAKRDAILWVGPSVHLNQNSEKYEAFLQFVVSRAWKAVYLDTAKYKPSEIEAVDLRAHNLEARTFISDAGPELLPPNRLPFYFLRGETGLVAPNCGDDPLGLFLRFEMLKRAGICTDVFAIGIEAPEDVAGLLEAARLSPAFHNMVVVSETDVDLESLSKAAERVTHWRCSQSMLSELVAQSVNTDDNSQTLNVLIHSERGRVKTDLWSCIDHGYPITTPFECIEAHAVLDVPSADVDDVGAFLQDPTASWAPYAAGIPFPRQRDYEASLLKYLRRFAKEGPSLTATAWIAAEDGSGATTALRQLCFDVAREGFPVLIARPQASKFDFRQLSTFLARATDRFAQSQLPDDIPWLIAFDAQHAQLERAFVIGLANGLKHLYRSAVVLAVQPFESPSSATLYRALGNNKNLGKPLLASVSIEEGIDVGRHLSRFVPKTSQMSDAQWRAFISDSMRISIDGTRSLFWVALRFWLQRLPGADGSLRKWLASKIAASVAGSKAAYAAILEVAVLAKHRITTPLALLEPDSQSEIKQIAADASNALGIRMFRDVATFSITFSHPLIAEETMRIVIGDSLALEAIEMKTCISLLDFELTLLGRLIRRPAAGTSQCLDVIEEIVTNALRVDPREAPRNYQVRDQIVQLLEEAPKSLWDISPIFNHHVAKARRHLASNPPSHDWSLIARIEQCSLAEGHINDALQIDVTSIEHYEPELNLQVSLALTYDVHARLEEESGNPELAAQLRAHSESAYLAAQRIDADNSYVLENFARFKVRRARDLPTGAERTRLLVDAIVLLELERSLDDIGHRDLPTLEELGNAYAILEEDGGRQYLGKLAAMGSEAAFVALARICLRRASAGDERAALEEAEDLLSRINPASATWLSHLTTYQVISRCRPTDFVKRLDALQQLASDRDFAWPQQMRMEYGILLFQAGDMPKRIEGAEVFRELREDLGRSGALEVPQELKYLRDPEDGFRRPLRTSITVKQSNGFSKNSYGIPRGWGTVAVVFREYHFARDRIRVKDDLDCLIQFTNFGPQAIPLPVGIDSDE